MLSKFSFTFRNGKTKSKLRGSLWGCETGYLVVVQRTRFAVVLLENKEQINVVCFTETILRNSHQCHYLTMVTMPRHYC